MRGPGQQSPLDVSYWKGVGRTGQSFQDVDRDDTQDRELGRRIIEEDDHWGIYL